MKRKKKHIIFYDSEIWNKLNEVKKSEDITYDELLKKYLKLPETDDVLQIKYGEICETISQKYKNQDIQLLMNLLWIFIIKSAQGEYDIKKLIYDIEADIKLKTYRKR